ncbi:hypothetical protein [Chromobacterium vaccinii]|uniref:hypothetical protein n=1 Tax=Chromobacterium vaccinii TaxID=1108595 RepID=UPI00131A2282|nr:hypothetical protein [Chromobacterium vaccinii]
MPNKNRDATMGSIYFEGWNAKVDDLEKLNNSPEILRIGLNFEQHPDLIFASADGNVSVYYNILREVKRRLTYGGFKITVILSTGDERQIILATDFATENGEDITSLVE